MHRCGDGAAHHASGKKEQDCNPDEENKHWAFDATTNCWEKAVTYKGDLPPYNFYDSVVSPINKTLGLLSALVGAYVGIKNYQDEQAEKAQLNNLYLRHTKCLVLGHSL